MGLSLLESGQALSASAHFAACASMAASQSDRPAQAQAMYHQACCAVVVQSWEIAADCLVQAVGLDSSLAAFARGDDTLAPLLARHPMLLSPPQGTGLAASSAAVVPSLPPPILEDFHSSSTSGATHQRSASGGSVATDSPMGHEAIRMARLARTDSRGSLISMVSMDSQSQSGTPLPIAAARSRAGALLLSSSLDSSGASSPQHRRNVSSGSSRRGNSMSSANGDILVTTRHARSVSNGHGHTPPALADAVGVAAGCGVSSPEYQTMGDESNYGAEGNYRERSESAGTLGLDLPEHTFEHLETEGESGDLGAIADAALASVQAEERFEAVQQAARRHSLQSIPSSALQAPRVSIASTGAPEVWAPLLAAAPSAAASQIGAGAPSSTTTSSTLSLPSPNSTANAIFKQDVSFNQGSGRAATDDFASPAPKPTMRAAAGDWNRPASAARAAHRRGRAKTDSLLLDLPPVQPSTPLSGQPKVLGFNQSTPRPSTAGAAAGGAASSPQHSQGSSFWGNALRGIQAAFAPSSSRPPAANSAPPSRSTTPKQPVPLFDLPCIDDSQDISELPKTPSQVPHKRSSRAASQESAGPLDMGVIGQSSTFASPRTTEPSPSGSAATAGPAWSRSSGFKTMPRGDSDASDVSLP